MAIAYVSLTPAASISAGAAPNVDTFLAGARASDGTYTAAMHWDELGNMVVDFRATISSATNFGGVKICCTPPDGITQVLTNTEALGPDGTGIYVLEASLIIDPAIFGGTIPASPVSLIFIAASVNANGVLNTDAGTGYPAGPSVTLSSLSYALGNFSIGTISSQWNPDNPTELWINVPVTPPSPIGNVQGGHIYLQVDGMAGGTGRVFRLNGTTPLDGMSRVAGTASPVDYGQFAYSASTQPWVVVLNAARTKLITTTTIRAYVVSYSANTDPVLDTAAAPSSTVSVSPYVAPKAGSGVEYEPLVASVTATALTADNSTGKLRTPIVVNVSLAGLPTPLPSHFAYELVLTFPGENPTDPTQVHVATGALTVNGQLGAGPDGISTPHSLALDTPTTATTVTIWARSVRVDQGSVVSRNQIVPSVTPHATVTIGGGATVDAGALANVRWGLKIDSGGFLTVDASGALAADAGGLYIPAGSISNSFLAALAVASANLQDNSVTAPKIPNATIATAHIAAAAITTALIANAAITDALIANCSVAKLSAGTANFSGTVTFKSGSSGPSVTITSSAVTIQSDASNSISISSGTVAIVAGSANTTITSTGISTPGVSAGNLEITLGLKIANIFSTTATAGARTLPATPAGFVNFVNGITTYKIPYYNS